MEQPRRTETADRKVRVTRWVATIAGLLGLSCRSRRRCCRRADHRDPELAAKRRTEQRDGAIDLADTGRRDGNRAVLCGAGPAGRGRGRAGYGAQEGKDAALNALFVVASSQRVIVTDRNVVLASAPRDQCLPAMPARRNHLHTGRRFATFVGLTDPAGKPCAGISRSQPASADRRGVHRSDRSGAPRTSAFATIDTRFSTTPTTLKLLAMVLAVVSTIVALVALWRLDQLDGRRMHRLIPTRWRKFTLADATVIFGFLLWHVIGANSRTMATSWAWPGRRPCRLHVNYFAGSAARGPLRLVLQPTGVDDPRQRRQPVDPVAGLDRRSAVLAAVVA